MINIGDIVFFKECKKELKINSIKAKFKGHGFGVMLGAVPQGTGEPTIKQTMALIGQVGFLLFDDISEFIGIEQTEICMKKFEEKYYPKENPLILPKPASIIEAVTEETRL